MNLHLNLEKDMSQIFPFFHCISECDTTLSVTGKDKKSFCETWQLFPEILAVFSKMEIVTDISEISEQGFKLLERFFVFLCSHTRDTDDVNIARRMLFTYGNRSIDNIPSTAGARNFSSMQRADKKWVQEILQSLMQMSHARATMHGTVCV